MDHHHSKTEDPFCEFCRTHEAKPRSTTCVRCDREILRLFLKALGRTALRLTPETVAIFAIIFVLPAIGHPYPGSPSWCWAWASRGNGGR